MSDALSATDKLPPLWSTEAKATEEIVLPLRLSCRWHRLVWYPVERTGDVLFGFTLRMLPEWRHFHASELTARYAGHDVVVDAAHLPRPATATTEVRLHKLDDLTPFIRTRPVNF
ncbi:MAG: hypothetical protein K2Y04_14290 [Caulobacteraceae bacterium]|nr:hypothetical protein [Caulobacteraceae bacterium]